MGKEYKITVTCENRDKYISRWIEDEDDHQLVHDLKNRVHEIGFFSFVDEVGDRTIFPKECLMKSVIQIKERTT